MEDHELRVWELSAPLPGVSDVSDRDPSVAAARPDVLIADRALLNLAISEDFDGPISHRLLNELARYALPVLVRLIESGIIFERLKELLRKSRQGFYIPPRTLTNDEISSLASDAVLEGLNLFIRNARSGNGWKIDGGARLTTYFVNACILAFRDPWRKMVTAMRVEFKVERVDPPDVSWNNHVDGDLNPEQRAISFSEIQRILTEVPDLLNQQIVTMAAQGYPCGAIAEFLGMNEHAVGERLRRIRRRNRGVREQKGGGEG